MSGASTDINFSHTEVPWLKLLGNGKSAKADLGDLEDHEEGRQDPWKITVESLK